MNEPARRHLSFTSNHGSSQKWLVRSGCRASGVERIAERALSDYTPNLLHLPTVSSYLAIQVFFFFF